MRHLAGVCATVEQRIGELTNDLAAADFCTQNFGATEAAFLAVLFPFNLLGLYPQSTPPNARYRQPATLRTAVFLCGRSWAGADGRRGCICRQPGVDWTNTSPGSKQSSSGQRRLRRS